MEKAIEYSLKAKRSKKFQQTKVNSQELAVNYIRQFYGDDILIYESFFILLTDRNANAIGYAKISQGGICGTIVDPRIILKYVIDTFASGVILAHNHPSGNTQPSESDIQVTERIKEVLKLINVDILDHLILTETSHFSFASEDML